MQLDAADCKLGELKLEVRSYEVSWIWSQTYFLLSGPDNLEPKGSKLARRISSSGP